MPSPLDLFARLPVGRLVLLFFSVFIAGCDAPPPKPAAAKPMPTIQAEVMTVQKSPWPAIVRSQGSLFGDEESVVGAKVAGRVASVHADMGDFLQEGDPMVTLDQADFLIQVQQAEAQLQQARSAIGLKESDDAKNLVQENAPPVREAKAVWEEATSSLFRAKELLEANALTRGEYEQALAANHVAEARYASSLNSVREKIALLGVRQAELSLALQRMEDTSIRSPLTGFVQNRQVSPGTYVSVGQPIAVVVQTDPMRFRGSVPERFAQSLAVGQEVTLVIESVDQPAVATVSRVSPMLGQLSRALSFEAKIDNAEHKLRAGLFAEAEVVIDPAAMALVIPHSAIVEFAGTQKVWKVVDGQAQEQRVTPGARRAAGREIIEGLAVGDQILVDASQGRVARIEPLEVTATEAPDSDPIDTEAIANSTPQTPSVEVAQ